MSLASGMTMCFGWISASWTMIILDGVEPFKWRTFESIHFSSTFFSWMIRGRWRLVVPFLDLHVFQRDGSCNILQWDEQLQLDQGHEQKSVFAHAVGECILKSAF